MKKKERESNSFAKINRIKPATNAFFPSVRSVAAVATVIPVVLVFIISITSSESLTRRGFSFFPLSVNTVAYDNLFKSGSQLVDSYLVTIEVTLLHTFVSVLIMTMYAYVLAQQRFPARKFYTFVVFFTMLFSGGLVPHYIMNVRYLHIDNSLWIFLLPSLASAYNVIILRTFITTTIPDTLFEAARIDGASHYRIYFSIVLPLFKAGIATIALFNVVNRWNDWFTGMLYIKNPKLIPIQTMLKNIQDNIEFLKQNAEVAGTPDGLQLLNSLPDQNLRMACTVIVIVPILCAYPFFQRYFVQGLTVGSVKG